MTFEEAMLFVARTFEGIGALVLLGGFILSVVLAIRSMRSSGEGRKAYTVMRESFGGAILLGLEVLVAADLLRTIAVAPTMENVLALGVIVLIRTVLSFSIDIEIEGIAPWRRALTSGASHVARAVRRSGDET